MTIYNENSIKLLHDKIEHDLWSLRYIQMLTMDKKIIIFFIIYLQTIKSMKYPLIDSI
ncbi:MAG: hypothetical protein ACXVHR_09535 [Methanobacterium sp.]